MSDCCEFISGHEQVIQHRFGRAATRHNGHSAASGRFAIHQQSIGGVGNTPEGVDVDGKWAAEATAAARQHETQHGGTGGLVRRHLRFHSLGQPAVSAFVVPVQERECGYDRRHPWLAATRSIPLRAVTSSPLGGLEEMSVKTITNTQTAKKTAFLF